MTLRRVEQVHNTTPHRHVPSRARTEHVGPVRGMPGHGVKNATVAAVRFGWPRSERKQPGRRYGPPTKRKAEGVVPGRAPLATSKRMRNYQRQNGRLLGMTARQHRQLNRMGLRSARRGRVAE